MGKKVAKKEDAVELVVLEEIKYPATKEEIESFVKEWEIIPTLDPKNEDKTDFNRVKEAYFKAVKFRTNAEKYRKLIGSPALEYTKKVNQIAKEFQAAINPTEERLRVEKVKVDNYEKELAQKAIDDENARQENISANITALSMLPSNAVGNTLDELIDLYGSIIIPSSEDFGERTDEGLAIYASTMQKLETMIQDAKDKLKVDEILEKNRLEAEEKNRVIKEAQEREKQKLIDDRKEFEKEKQDMLDEMEKIKEEKEILVAEMKAEELEKEQLKEEQEREKQRALDKIKEAKKLKAEAIQREVEAKAKKEESEKLFNARFEETLAIFKGLDGKNILLKIIDNEVPFVKWVG